MSSSKTLFIENVWYVHYTLWKIKMVCQWLGYKVPRELNLWIVWGLESYLTGLTYIIDRFTNYIVVIYIKCKKERRRIKLGSILVIFNIKMSHTTDVRLKLLFSIIKIQSVWEHDSYTSTY